MSALFHLRLLVRMAALIGASLLCLANAAHAQSNWTAFNTGSVPGGPITGTLLGANVSVTSAYPSGTPTTGDNVIGGSPAPMWSNTYAPGGLTPAAIFPAGASSANSQAVVQVGIANYDSTAAHPGRTTITFSEPVVNPVVLFYSVDQTTIDFAGSTNTSGAAVTPSISVNSGGALTGTQVASNGTGTFTVEGCFDNSPRVCGVVRYTGIFSSVQFTHYSGMRVQDGVGFQVGADQLASALPVPALPLTGLAALTLGIAAFGARRLGRRA